MSGDSIQGAGAALWALAEFAIPASAAAATIVVKENFFIPHSPRNPTRLTHAFSGFEQITNVICPSIRRK
jgi:hypothetical protein